MSVTMRPRGNAVLFIAALSAVVLGMYAAQWLSVRAPQQRGSDFSASYVAAQLWRDGQGDQLYNQTLEAQRHAAINSPGFVTDLPFITPPLTAVLAAPLTLLDPQAAYHAAAVIEVLLLLAAAVVAGRDAPWPAGTGRGQRLLMTAAALASVATLAVALLAQWDGVCALAVAIAYALWRRGRPGWAGFALAFGICLVKPHLGVGLAAFMIGRHDWRAVGGAAGAIAVEAAASLVLVGPTASRAWFGALALSLGHSPPASTQGVSGFFASWLGWGPVTVVLAAIAATVAVAACALLGARSRTALRLLEPALGGAVALSLLAAPHLLGHDLALLIPVFVWLVAAATAADAASAGRWPGGGAGRLLVGWAAFNVVALLDLGNGAPAPPGRLVPIALAAAGAIALRHCRPTRVRQSQ